MPVYVFQCSKLAFGLVGVKKVNEISFITVFLIYCLFIAKIVYSAEVGQKDLNYQLKVFPIYMESNRQYNSFSSLIWEFIGNPSFDLANDLCKQSKTSYKVLRKLSKDRADIESGKLFQKFNLRLVQLFAVRNAILLLLIQSCASDPTFEKPDVWNSFEARWKSLDKQEVEASSGVEQELNNIDNYLQEH